METSIKKILCATDFSYVYRKVIGYGTALAGRFNARLLVFHAVCFPQNPIYGTVDVHLSSEHHKLIRKAQEKIESLMTDHIVDWKAVVTIGGPVDEAARVAAQENVDLVIAASHDLGGLKRILMGTVVEQMARDLSCPLMVIRPLRKHGPEKESTEESVEFKRIVIGCDVNADSGFPALQYGMAFAEKFNADIDLFNSLDKPIDAEIMDSAAAPYETVQQVFQDRVRRHLLQLIPKDRCGGCKIMPVLMPGAPGEGICIHAEKIGADLIVVGVKSRTGLGRMLIGSTTEFVLRHGPCPVLVVPEKSGGSR
jgi:nucleotide-binding universal stress UspA family protein